MHSEEPFTDPDEQPQLNFDILRLVCNYLIDVSDVLSFALTCSSLTEDSFRRRLRMSPVDLSNGRSLDRFHTFIFSNEPSRAPCIRGLKLPDPYEDPECREIIESGFFNRLWAVLEAAVRIQFLEFSTSISAFVFGAVAQANTVQELWVFADTYKQPLRTHLTAFRSPLRSLHVMGSELVGDVISARFLHDDLGHLAPTLESLDLDDFPIRILPSSLTTQFTAVRSLKLKTSFSSDFHTLDVLLRLFPNLDDTLDLGRRLMGNIAEDEYDAFRERSKETQKRHSWSGLDKLVCDLPTAYLLALQCPIRRMDSEVQHMSSHEYLYLADTLRHNGPRQLHIGLPLYDGFNMLDGMFPPEAAEKLTHLVVFADAGARYRCGARYKARNVHWDRLVGRLLLSIKHLHLLTHLRIVFRSTTYYSVRQPPPNRDLMNRLCEIDLHPAAIQLIAEMPTLDHLFLTSCGRAYALQTKTKNGQPVYRQRIIERWLSTKAWRVDHDHDEEEDRLPADAGLGSGPCTMELSPEVAERIVNQEELHLFRHEEDKVLPGSTVALEPFLAHLRFRFPPETVTS
ncbi:hypothetical protein V8D89_007923 [Ganoderma adspersum]